MRSCTPLTFLLSATVAGFGCAESAPEASEGESDVVEQEMTVQHSNFNGEGVRLQAGEWPNQVQLAAWQSGTKKQSRTELQANVQQLEDWRCTTETYCEERCCQWQATPGCPLELPDCVDGGDGGMFCCASADAPEGGPCVPADPGESGQCSFNSWVCAPELCQTECWEWEVCDYARGMWQDVYGTVPDGALKVNNGMGRLAFGGSQVEVVWGWGCAWDWDAGYHECGLLPLGDVDLAFRDNDGYSFSVNGTQTETRPITQCEPVCNDDCETLPDCPCEWVCTEEWVTTRLTGVVNRSEASVQGEAFGLAIDQPTGAFMESGLNVTIDRTRSY